MADDSFARLVSSANPAYRPTYPPTSPAPATPHSATVLDPFFDDDDDADAPHASSQYQPPHLNAMPNNSTYNSYSMPESNPNSQFISPDSAFASTTTFARAMESKESGLPLASKAAPMAKDWMIDDDAGEMPSFEGSSSFPGIQQQRTPTKPKKRRKFRWPWQKEVERVGDRIISINEEETNLAEGYCSNYVSTSKYNLATFIPKFLKGRFVVSVTSIISPYSHYVEQFSNYANIFFLFTACIQQIPGVSPTNQYTTILPLGLVLLASAYKELQEDTKRHQSDKDLNSRHAKVSKFRTPMF